MNEEIKTITEKFVKELAPLKVYLFGSYAKGNFTAESDYDFYILMPDSCNVTNTLESTVKKEGLVLYEK